MLQRSIYVACVRFTCVMQKSGERMLRWYKIATIKTVLCHAVKKFSVTSPTAKLGKRMRYIFDTHHLWPWVQMIKLFTSVRENPCFIHVRLIEALRHLHHYR